jgi:hypothetical protein
MRYSSKMGWELGNPISIVIDGALMGEFEAHGAAGHEMLIPCGELVWEFVFAGGDAVFSGEGC